MRYKCPVCGNEMTEYAGNVFHPGDSKYGMTLSCQNVNCSAQEVQGHGNNLKGAYDVVCLKYGRKSDKKG